LSAKSFDDLMVGLDVCSLNIVDVEKTANVFESKDGKNFLEIRRFLSSEGLLVLNKEILKGLAFESKDGKN
jgi:hypothetical protein